MERLKSAGLFVITPFVGAWQLTAGTLQGVAALFSAGRWRGQEARSSFWHAGITFQAMHAELLTALNPNAKFNSDIQNSQIDSRGFGTCIISNLLHLDREIDSAVGARLFSLFIRMPAMLFGRVIDGVVAVPLTLASCITLGKFDTLNSLASKHLTFPQLITDIYESLALTINPSFFKDDEEDGDPGYSYASPHHDLVRVSGDYYSDYDD